MRLPSCESLSLASVPGTPSVSYLVLAPLVPLYFTDPSCPSRLTSSLHSFPFHLGLRGTTGTTWHRMVRTTDAIPPEYMLWANFLFSAILLNLDTRVQVAPWTQTLIASVISASNEPTAFFFLRSISVRLGEQCPT